MTKKFALLAGVIERSGRFSAAAAAGALIAIVIITLYGVLMRRVFNAPVTWAIELPAFMFIAICALTLAFVQIKKSHIRMEAVTSRLRPVAQNILACLSLLLFLAYSIFVIWGSWERALYSLENGMTTLEAHFPLFAVEVLLPIGLAVLCLQLLVELARTTGELFRRRGK